MEIKNKWAVYGGAIPLGIGKIVGECSSRTLMIEYSSSQMYSAEAWDSGCVERFGNMQKAAEFYGKWRKVPTEVLLNVAGNKFPLDFEAELDVKKSFLECLSRVRDLKG